MVMRDTQSSRTIDFHGWRGVFFLTFGFKDVLYGTANRELFIVCQSGGNLSIGNTIHFS